MEDKEVLQLNLHYILNEDNLHSMDAKIFNECEKQFIQMLQSLNKYFDNPLELEVFAREEGGVIGKYCVKIVKNKSFTSAFLLLVGAAARQFFTSYFPTALQRTEETKNKLENIKTITDLVKSGDLTSELYDYATSQDKELQKYKSNFFAQAKQEEKIKSIELSRNYNDNVITQAINYTDFDKCILVKKSTTNESEIDAKIYIVAPILVKGRRDAWKGIYNEEAIEFKVTDKDFLEQVYAQQHNFGNGSFINCKMRIKTTFNITENTESLHREVFAVISKGDDNNVVQIYKRRKKKNDNVETPQMDLFSNEN